jgi:hypothetical protein
VALIVEMREEIGHLRFGGRVGRLTEVRGELTDGANVGFAGALGKPGELEVLKELAAEK